MSLADRLTQAGLPGRILTFDIETQRGVWESFSPKVQFLHADRCIVPPRILCFAAKWYGEDKILFHAAWRDGDEQAYERMCQRIWALLNEATVVVTWNGDRFDLGWVVGECRRFGMDRPGSYKSVDLIKIARKHFGPALTYRSLQWSARMWLHDSKLGHGGTDLWYDIRHGTPAEKRDAQKLMREYNQQDVLLTEKMLGAYLPWLPVNMALYRADEFELRYCTKCGKTDCLKPEGIAYTGAFGYQQYRCTQCGSLSRGKRAKVTTELRTIP